MTGRKNKKHPPVILGSKFGRLTVICKIAPDDVGRERYECRCECGTIVTKLGNWLKSGNTRSCGCLAKERRAVAIVRLMKGKPQQHLYRRGLQVQVGQTFGRLTVLEIVQPDTGRRSYSCTCICGNSIECRSETLRGARPSCGCWHSDWASETFSKAPGEISYGRLYTSCRTGARSRGIEFSLSREEHREIIIQDCYYCGAPPAPFNAYVKKDGTISRRFKPKDVNRAWVKANGVDRYDNSKGYTRDNCVPCCSFCNHAKRDHSAEEFLALIAQIATFQQHKKAA